MSYWRQAIDQLTAISAALTGSEVKNIPLSAWTIGATGAPLAEFGDTTAGLDLVDSETIAIRWPNDAAPPTIGVNLPIPLDINTSYPLYFDFIVSKTGATVGDATSLTGAFYNVAVGGLHNADTAVVCVSGAVTGNATARTTTRLTYTIGISDLVAPPGFMFVTAGPTAGTLGTDDFLIHSTTYRYTKRAPVTLS